MLLYTLMLIPLILETCLPYLSGSWGVLANIAVILSVTGFATYVVTMFKQSSHEILLITQFLGASLIMALVSFILNALLVSPHHQIQTNLYFTLSLGLILLYLFEYYIMESYPTFRKIGMILFVLIFCFAIMKIEKGMLIIPYMLITYILQDQTLRYFLASALLSLILFCLAWFGYRSVDYSYAFILFLPLVHAVDSISFHTFDRSFLSIYPLVIWIGYAMVTYI